MVRSLAITSLLALFFPITGLAAPGAAELGQRLEPFLSCLSGKEGRFHLQIEASVKVGKDAQAVTAHLSRIDEQSFVLAIDHPEYPLRLERTADSTRLVLPVHKTAFIGEGAVDGADILRPLGLTTRLVSEACAASPYVLGLSNSSSEATAGILVALVGLKSEDGLEWSAPALKDARIKFTDGPPVLEVTARDFQVKLTRKEDQDPAARPAAIPEGFKVSKIDRAEMEKLFVRAVRRGLEVLAPASWLEKPVHEGRKVPHGELRWVEDQRLVLLKGTPREVGLAHGQLLAEETRRCADSTVYLVGAAQTARSGRWFFDDLRDAYRRLEKFIPKGQKDEVDALAEGAGLPVAEARMASVFPELFHCSGFALFGKATADGKLYHGRVLDYMTAIGLQDCAATFVISLEGKIPFVNVGYAGFVGSVSGMNAKQISLGEMGGRGEGKWDGVPMSSLMRRALEECSTLEEVKKLWRDSPRTCEYYYVFADGKIPDAVGVAATPEKVEFIGSGEGHPLLGEGIADAVVLSAGDRLKTLRERVQSSHGKIDAAKAMGLMACPVAMTSNLHDVLFVPQDLVLYVANADRKDCAAKRPYVRLDLRPLLGELPQ